MRYHWIGRGIKRDTQGAPSQRIVARIAQEIEMNAKRAKESTMEEFVQAIGGNKNEAMAPGTPTDPTGQTTS